MREDAIFLAQTDTTIGLLSKDSTQLSKIKSRPDTKPFLTAFASNSHYSTYHRVPKTFANLFRRASKTTFVINNKACRIVKEPIHKKFLEKYRWLYSTSANRSGETYNDVFCKTHATIVVEDKRGFFETKASTIYKLGKSTKKRLR